MANTRSRRIKYTEPPPVGSRGESLLFAIQIRARRSRLVTLHIEQGLGSAHATLSLQIPLLICELVRSGSARASCAEVGERRLGHDRLVRRPFERGEFEKRRWHRVFPLLSVIPQVDRRRHHHGNVTDDERYTILLDSVNGIFFWGGT
jgi:hypothetical protein